MRRSDLRFRKAETPAKRRPLVGKIGDGVAVEYVKEGP
jgi:hypothetical protein